VDLVLERPVLSLISDRNAKQFSRSREVDHVMCGSHGASPMSIFNR
jgi:hypothetical protein